MRIILGELLRTSSEQLKVAWPNHTERLEGRMLPYSKFIDAPTDQCPPLYLNNKFVTNSNFGYSSTRGANKRHLPNTNYYRNSFEFQGALMF